MSTPVERLHAAFQAGRDQDRALLMPFLVCGYPDVDTFVDLCEEAAAAGADVIEVGIPFSDPIMDGPVIQAATTEVLRRGLPLDDAFRAIERASAACGLPLVAMTYYNLPFRRGLERFAAAIAAAGATGAILPDLSVEDSGHWVAAARAESIAPVFIASQTSPPDRLRALAETGDGFVYAASLLGVTGVRDALSDQASSLVERIRAATDLPVALGIGVSTPEHARAVAAFADGVIVGSAVVARITESDDPVGAVGAFLRDLRAACSR